VPAPIVDPRALAGAAELDRQRAAEMSSTSDAAKSADAFELRQLGALLREYGEADARDDKEKLHELRTPLLRGGHNAQQKGPEGLLRLRAYQQAIFLRELARWETTREESDEPKQVGGGITRTLQASRWVDERGRFIAGEPERVALFMRRFAEVLGLQGKDYALSLDEGRALYAFLLVHSPGEGPAAWAFRLRKIDELSSFDAAYPRSLARGVALMNLGQPAAAVVEFKEHLGRSPDGPYTLRARNFLAAALDMAERQGAFP
jgi:hypothetical protein